MTRKKSDLGLDGFSRKPKEPTGRESPTSGETRIEAVPLDQWVREELAAPEPPWLLHQMIMPKGLTIVAGRPKLGKSFWTVLMGMSMASGKAFGPIRPHGQSSCLYFDLEGVARQTAQRVALLSEGMGVPLGSLSLFRMARQRDYQLLESGNAAALVDAIREYGVQTVFLDTFARTFSGDENNKKEAQKFLDTLSEIRSATGVACVLVHHVNKDSFTGREAVMMDPDAGLRGSSAIAGAYDVVVTLQNGWIEGEFKKFAISRGKYTPDWWCDYDLCGEKDTSGEFTMSWLEFGHQRDEYTLIERSPSSSQPGFRRQ